MLNNHPQIALLYEAELFGLYPPAGDRLLPCDWAMRLDFFNQVFSRHQLDPATLPPHSTRREGMLALAQAWAARKQATVMGDKSVACHMKLPQLAQIFPEADFIILWRNPLDTCRSVVNAGKNNRFFSQRGILLQTLFGAKQLADGVLKLRAAGRRVHEVVYDDLVHDPKNELTKICQFIGLPFDPRMLDLAAADYSMLPAGEHHRSVRSGAVQKKDRPTEVLPPEFIAKGQRFATLWQTRYAQLAFARTLAKDSNGQTPRAREILKDQTICAFWYHFSALKHFILSRLPIALWTRLRQENAHNQPEAKLDPANKAPSSLGSAWNQLKFALTHATDLMTNFTNNAIEQPSLRQQFRQHWLLILANGLFLSVIIAIHFYCNRHLSFIPIYLIPCVWLTLKLDARWGALLAIFAACIPPWMHYFSDSNFLTFDVAFFNTITRLILFLIIIVLTSHIRRFQPFLRLKKSGGASNFINVLARHWAVISAASLLLFGIAFIDLITSPQLNLLPLYLLPCVMTTLAAGRAWGTALAVLASVVGTMMQRYDDIYYQYLAVEMWNTLMRFIIFQVTVVMLDRIRQENSGFLAGKLEGSSSLAVQK